MSRHEGFPSRAQLPEKSTRGLSALPCTFLQFAVIDGFDPLPNGLIRRMDRRSFQMMNGGTAGCAVIQPQPAEDTPDLPWLLYSGSVIKPA